MSPELYIESTKKRPDIRIRLLAGEEASALKPGINDIISQAKLELNKTFPNTDTAKVLLSGVIGEEKATQFINAYKNKEEISAKF
jgi:hypothetical protein